MFENRYHGRKVLITGHTGFKGSWLAAWLTQLGANVVGLSLKPNTTPSHFDLLKLPITSYFIDVRSKEQVAKVLHEVQPEIIFHLAAQPLVRDSYADPLYTLETNIMGTANLLQACQSVESVQAVVIVTSDKCYENKEWVWGYRENDPMGGYDPYSVSKGCAELVTASFRNAYFNLEKYGQTHHVLVASVRAGNVIGGGDWAKDRLIPDIVRATVKQETVPIRCPHATRPWQHVLECLSGYLCIGVKLLQGDKQFAEGWNFAPASSGEVPVETIVRLMQSHWPQLSYEIIANPNQLHEAHLLKLDASKANSILKWKSVWGLEETIQVTTAWYRDFYEREKIMTMRDIDHYVNSAKTVGLGWTG